MESQRTYLKRRLERARELVDEIEAAARTMDVIVGDDEISVRRRIKAFIAISVDRLHAHADRLDAEDELATLTHNVQSTATGRV